MNFDTQGSAFSVSALIVGAIHVNLHVALRLYPPWICILLVGSMSLLWNLYPNFGSQQGPRDSHSGDNISTNPRSVLY